MEFTHDEKQELRKKYAYMYETTFNDFYWNGMMVNHEMIENYLHYIQSEPYFLFGFAADENREVYCKADFCARSGVEVFSKVGKS